MHRYPYCMIVFESANKITGCYNYLVARFATARSLLALVGSINWVPLVEVQLEGPMRVSALGVFEAATW